MATASTGDTTAHAPTAALAGRSLNPFRAAVGLVGYLGRLALMTTSALGAIVRPGSTILSFPRQSAIQLDRLLASGMPMVGLVHVAWARFSRCRPTSAPRSWTGSARSRASA